MKQFTHKRLVVLERGFTLVELMVSLTIFSVVMLISTGTLLIMIDLNAKAQAVYSAVTNLSFAVDSITREIRTGYSYYCSDAGVSPSATAALSNGVRDCTNANSIAFTRERDGKRAGYRYNAYTDVIEFRDVDMATWMPTTSDDIMVEAFTLVTANTTLADNEQPTVDIFIQGSMLNGLATTTRFYLQSHVVQRHLDIQ